MIKYLIAILKATLCWLLTAVYLIIAMFSILIFGKQRSWEFWFSFYGKSLLFVLGVKLKITGAENIKGPAIITMPHQSLLDIFILPAIAPKKSTGIAKKEFKRIPLFAYAMNAGHCIFVDRKNTEQAIKSIEDGLKLLPKDYSILIFPEGTRSPNFKLQKLKKGIVHLAIQSKRPIVTIGHFGMEEIGGKKGSIVFTPNTLHLHANKKIDTSDWKTEKIEEHLNEIKESFESATGQAKQDSFQSP